MGRVMLLNTALLGTSLLGTALLGTPLLGTSRACAQPPSDELVQPPSDEGDEGAETRNAPEADPPESAPEAEPPTGAQPSGDVEAAVAHFHRGVELYRERAFPMALVEFELAYENAPHHRVLYNIAQAQYELHDFAASLSTFERYLREGGEDVDEARRAEVQSEIEHLRSRVSMLHVVVDVVGAEIRVDGVDRGRSPLPPMRVNIGRHRVRVSAEGHLPVERQIRVGAETSFELELELEPVSTAPVVSPQPLPGPDAKPVNRRRRWRLATRVAAGAFGAATIVSFGLTLRANGQLGKELDRYPATPAAVESRRDQLRRREIATDVLGSAGAASLLALIVTLLRSDGSSDSPVSVSVGSRRLTFRADF